MTAKPTPDDELHKALQQQQKLNKEVDRILWIGLPVFAFLLAFIISNINIFSVLGTFVVLAVSFIMVGIKRKSLAVTLVAILLYCLVDNYLSHNYSFKIDNLKNQLLCMILFTAIIGMMRPMTDRALINYHKNKPQ